jgi:hypothetical protein
MIPPEAGKVFDDYTVNFAITNIVKHTIKARTIEIRAGLVCVLVFADEFHVRLFTCELPE